MSTANMDAAAASSTNDIEHLEFNLRFAIQSLPDKKIRCPSSWTVLRLKNFLYEECSSKPEVDKQRLIYAGHCLKDGQILREIFNRNVDGIDKDSDVLQVVHLVCASKEQIKAAKNLSPGGDGLRNRQSPSSSQPDDPQHRAPPVVAPTFDDVPQDVNQAYAQAYHNYLRTYYSRQFGGAFQNPLNRYQQASGQINLMAGIQNPVNNPPMPAAAPNNFPRADLNENAPDFLDLVYKLVRFIFLVAILMYSSMDRVIFVIAAICLMWYVQMRRERDNRNAVRNEQVPNRDQAPNQPPAPGLDNNNNADNNNNQLPDVPQDTTPARTSAWSVFWSTVASFFSSLIPEPMPMN